MKHPKNYYLGKEIGEGGYGKVYRGYEQKLQIQVCIKEIDLSGKGQKWNANNEKTIIKMVDHPNIVKYMDDYQFNGKQYIVMELIETGNLSNLIDEYRLKHEFIPEELILKFFFTACFSS
jgi:serine/threonine protein kinase